MWQKINRALIEGVLLQKCWKGLTYRLQKLWLALKKKANKLTAQVSMFVSKPFRDAYVKKQKVVKNRIVFSAVDNRYDCNPKYIAEEIIRRELPWEIYWLRAGKKDRAATLFPEQITVLNRGSFEAIQAMATAKVWVENELRFLKPYYLVKKKPEQYYLQTWHGSFGFKKMGRAHHANQSGKRLRAINRMSRLCNENTHTVFTNSQFETQVFQNAYWDKVPMAMVGHARNDILINQNPEQMAQIKEKVLTYCKAMPALPAYGEPSPEVLEKRQQAMDTHYVLYAPTYRPGGKLDLFTLDFERLVYNLQEKFGGQWKVLVRYHLFNRKAAAKAKAKSCVVMATDYPDMQELMVMADVGISDYSSWICDYALMSRPAFMYAVDYADYAHDRGLYYPLDETPFPVATDNEEMEAVIEAFDMEKYDRERKAFLADKGCVEEGKAAGRIVDMIAQLMEQ